MTDDRDEVGSLSEEAKKLLAALQDRAGGASGEYASAVAGAAGGLSETMRAIDEHIATDGAECRYCPMCRAVSVVRSTSPEFREHLSSAAASLVRAFGAAMTTDVPRAAQRWAEAADRNTQAEDDANGAEHSREDRAAGAADASVDEDAADDTGERPL